ncbi:D-tyrosyl-tRNA(Tyr) deacylase [Candidatus Acetothermia bacterium]|jgi:D-tyrosyl-tRNA(Tyr) deacylase|nr:D-tyrosyl-tRNA(Tyr) deacylase [Candidatus Acetothermia bacterium]MCI2426542.1 D-tyrosyl-tRNA(Tyr) deacylase [Candidatus Acetothermia bacterium]MCI2427478.1 D-tyrosyl-tRNA(Tyr) deacylase [Candidatus Acetothermia bacterium]MCI2428649.1 D-tyrosyl-tRNA(Tyr) deacylase [Candidatus Acetothermia bacterium]
MRIVLQRVRRALVRVDSQIIARIDNGLLLLIGIAKNDDGMHAYRLADKIIHLRIFEDTEGKMNLSIDQVGGEILAVSQFTLCGNTDRGRRPSFTDAAPPHEAEPLFMQFVDYIRKKGIAVQTGKFGAKMDVELINDGPVTFILT